MTPPAAITAGDAQRRTALRAAEEARINIAIVKRSLRSGELTLTDAMRDPPRELRHALLIDVIRWTNRTRKTAALAYIGRQALRDNVNLMVPLGSASVMSRAWVAEHGYLWWKPSK